MKRVYLLLCLFVVAVAAPVASRAQLMRKAGDFIQSAFQGAPADSVSSDATAESDSARLRELTDRIQQMQLNEIRLQTELDEARYHNRKTDSLKRAERRRSIDSLRALTPGEPVILDKDTLFMLYARRGGYSAFDRAEMLTETLRKIGSSPRLSRDSVYLIDNESYIDIMYGEKVLLSLTENDALWQNTSLASLADEYSAILSTEISRLQDNHSLMQIVRRALLFILVIVVQYLLFRLTNKLFRRLRRHIIRISRQRLKPIIIRDYELLNTRRLCRIMIFGSNIIRYIVLFIQLTITVPILFAIFPQTEKLAFNIFSYIIEPVKMILRSILDYIPNLFVIVIIWLCIRYIVKGIGFIAGEIENEKLKISGFYPDWARPTFNIVRFLLYAFMIAMIYPYLPGSESGVFQGISVFVGLIISLGSSTVIGNIIAGLVITYMRPFKLGDRIKLDDTTGNVIEKTPFVTRLRTPKNEVVTIPNSFIMSSHTVNYSASARQFGLIIHTSVTIGYDVPWRQVHQLLIDAARITPGVLQHPKPFVLETGLDDYYPCYQINAYITDADHIGDIYSALHQNIQDTFNDAGVEIMSPHYYAARDGSPSTIPTDQRRDITPD